MKIEEAIETLEEKRKYCKMFYELSANPQEDYPSTAKFMDALELALTALRSMQETAKPGWISVKERLPEKHSEYIVCACDEGEPIDERIWGDTVVVCADYYDGAFTWYEGNTEYDISDIVTHWMPLPEPPEEG